MKNRYWFLFWFIVMIPCNIQAQSTAGVCVEGDCENGSGTYVLPDGTKYVGEFKGKGIAHGRGRITYPSGTKYEGEFAADQYNGHGTYTNREGTYVGEWEQGKFHGQGTHVYRKGGVYVGEWRAGQYHGRGTYIYASGTTYVGQWENGKVVKIQDEEGVPSPAAQGK